MKKLICALVLAVATVGLGAPVAQADTRGCVSRSEFQRVHHRMGKARVHRIFDTRGHRDVRVGRIEIRGYRTCSRHGAVSVSYRRKRVTAKVGVWG
jgi:hypothetical protein